MFPRASIVCSRSGPRSLVVVSPMINGAHVIIQSRQPEADRAFFRDALGLSHVDVGGGWLIFALPPAEVAVHPSKKNSVQEFYLMCDDVNAFVKKLTGRGVVCGPIEDQGWGLLTSITLPGGGTLGAYEPRHVRPTSNARSRTPVSAVRKKGTPKRAPAQRAAKKAPSTAAQEKKTKKVLPKKVAKR